MQSRHNLVTIKAFYWGFHLFFFNVLFLFYQWVWGHLSRTADFYHHPLAYIVGEGCVYLGLWLSIYWVSVHFFFCCFLLGLKEIFGYTAPSPSRNWLPPYSIPSRVLIGCYIFSCQFLWLFIWNLSLGVGFLFVCMFCFCCCFVLICLFIHSFSQLWL